jgi:hypothetical protein
MKINELIFALNLHKSEHGDEQVYIVDGYADYPIKWVEYYSQKRFPHILEGFYIRLLNHREQQMINKPEYTWKELNNCIVIWDKNKGKMTVTNGIEMVLKEISTVTNLFGKTIIYCDSENEYNQVLINKEGEFQGYETPARLEVMMKVTKSLLDILKKD